MQLNARSSSMLHTTRVPGQQRLLQAGRLLQSDHACKLRRSRLYVLLREDQPARPTAVESATEAQVVRVDQKLQCYGRLLLFSGAVTAALLCGRRPALAANMPPTVYTVDDSSSGSAARRGVLGRLKAATGAPLQALDRLLFPDEAIAFVRSEQHSGTVGEGPAQPAFFEGVAPGSAAVVPLPTPLGAKEAAALTGADQPPTQHIRPASSTGGHQLQLDWLGAAASAVAAKLADGLAEATASLPAPSWPAESCAMAGISKMAGVTGASSSLPTASSAALTQQLRVWGYAMACLVLSVLAWQLAASMPGDKRRKPAAAAVATAPAAAASTAAALATPPAGNETAGMLAAPDGSSCTPLGHPDELQQQQSPAGAQPTVAVFSSTGPLPNSLLGQHVVGPYCLREAQQPAAASMAFTVADSPPASLVSSELAEPVCASPRAAPQVTPGAAARASGEGCASGDVQLPGRQVVGPYCLMSQHPAAARAAAATSEALAEQAVALHAAAAATAVDDELSCVLTEQAAASKAGEVVQAALAAAAAEEQDESAPEDAVSDDEPLFRVILGQEAAAASGPAVSIEGALAAEAVREALMAESAAAAAAVAAERAHAAAHLIQEAAAAHTAATAAAAAAHSAAEVAVLAVAGAELAAAAVAEAGAARAAGAGMSEADMAQLAAEAKAAEAAAAMAAMRESVAAVNQGTTDVGEDAQAWIAEAVAAEFAAAELSNALAAAGTAEPLALSRVDLAGAPTTAETAMEAAAEQQGVEDMEALIDEAVMAEAAAGQLLGTIGAADGGAMAPSLQESAGDAGMQALIAEAIAAEAAAASAKLARAELVAEAIAAEAAAVAGQAAAEAAGSAGAAGGSAGQAAEVAKCLLVQPGSAHRTSSTGEASGTTVSTGTTNVTVSWVLGMDDDTAQQQLAALAAASGHPAIITSSGKPLAATDAAGIASALSSADADAFNDEFPPSSEDEAMTTAAFATAIKHDSAAEQTATVAEAEDSSEPPSSLAAALDAASLQQMQQASATAVQLAHSRLVRLYWARRMAAAAAATAAVAKSAKPDGGSSTSSRTGRSSAVSRAAAAAAAYSYLGVSDTALALALASLDAAGPKEEEPTTTSSTDGGQLTGSAQGKEALATPATAAEHPAVPANVTATDESENPASPSAGGSFSVPVVVVPPAGDPYTAVAGALTGRRSVASSSSSSSDGFDVLIQVEAVNEEKAGKGKKDVVGSASAQARPRRTAARQPASIPIEWISTPNSSKRVQLKQRAAAMLAEEQQRQPQLDAGAASGVEASANEQVTVGREATEPCVVSLNATGAASAGDAASTGDPSKPQPAPKSNSSQQGLPVGWGGAGSSSKKPQAVPGSWSAVSAQLAAELETELAELVASAAARLDSDMHATYSTPQLCLPAPGTPASSMEGPAPQASPVKPGEKQAQLGAPTCDEPNTAASSQAAV